MLLVDDDQPESAQRREDGRARADADPRLARPQPRPLVVALAGRELRVQDGDGVAEARDEARHDLRRQRDLGDEHDHPAAARERRRGGPQVDLGLARAGDAVQQQPLARRRGHDRAQRRGLVGGELAAARARRRRRRARARGARRAARCSTSPRASSRRSAARSRPAKRGSDAQQRALAVGQALLRVDGAAVGAAHSAVLARVPFGGSTSESARAGVEQYSAAIHSARSTSSAGSRAVEDAARRDRVVLGALGQPGDHADDVAMAEGHDEHRAHVDALGPQVVERPAQRAGRRERLDLDYRWHRGPR